MTLRITQNAFFRRTVADIQRSYARLFLAQSQVTTQKRIQSPSDDPGGTARALSLQSDDTQLGRLSDNASEAKSLLDSAAGSLEDLSGILGQVRERIVAATTGSASQLDRNILAE